VNLSPEVIQKLKTVALNDFFFFSKVVLNYRDLSPTLHGDICHFLMNLKKGVALLNIPRGFYKSTLATICYPLWRAVRDPDIRILVESKSERLASDSINEIRGRVQTAELFQLLFPERLPNFKSKEARWSSKAASLRRPREWKEATFEAAGAGTRVIGRHYHLIIEDDPIYPEFDQMTGMQSVPSDEDVQKAIGWHELRLPLMIPPATERLTLCVGTRWKKYDFIDYIKRTTPDLLAFERPAIENGKAIFPEQMSLERLSTLRASMSRYTWASQYMNSPVADADIVFRESWIKEFDRAPNGLRKVMTVDPAISMRENACDSAIVVVGVAPNGRRYVLDTWNKHVNVTALVDQIFSMVKKNLDGEKTRLVGVEVVAYQAALEQILREEMHKRDYYFTVVQLKPKTVDHHKDHRIQALVPYFENGAIFLRKGQVELRQQLVDYPAPKKDLVDALAWHLPMVKSRLPRPTEPEDNNPFLFENILAELRRPNKRGVLFGCRTHVGDEVGEPVLDAG